MQTSEKILHAAMFRFPHCGMYKGNILDPSGTVKEGCRKDSTFLPELDVRTQQVETGDSQSEEPDRVNDLRINFRQTGGD